MYSFPESEYYVEKYFGKIPYPYLLWPILLLLIYFSEGLAFSLISKKPIDIAAIGAYFGQVLLSISSLLVIILIYRMNIYKINMWVELNSNQLDTYNLINKLNMYHAFLFGRYALLFTILVLAIRRIYIQIFTPEYQLIFGIIINDTITTFLLISLAITVIGSTILIYVLSSYRIEVYQPLEINTRYKDLESIVVKNTFASGIVLGFYGAALFVWGIRVDQGNTALLLNAIIFIIILFSFFIGSLGIRNGKSLTKASFEAKMLMEMKKYDFINQHIGHNHLRKTSMCLAYNSILNILKDTEKVKEWPFNLSSLIYLALTIIASISVKYALEHILRIVIFY